MSIRLIYLNLGTLINFLAPLVKLGPLDLMGPHEQVTRVWGKLLEVNFHLLHVHALVWAPPMGPSYTNPYILGATGSPGTNLL